MHKDLIPVDRLRLQILQRRLTLIIDDLRCENPNIQECIADAKYMQTVLDRIDNSQ